MSEQTNRHQSICAYIQGFCRVHQVKFKTFKYHVEYNIRHVSGIDTY